MQLSEMRQRVSQRLTEGATGPVYYPAAEIDAALNEANRLFCLISLGIETTVSWTPSSTFTHMLGLFPDFICPLRITGSDGRTIRPATLADLTAINPSWIYEAGTPARYVSLGCDMIGIYPYASVTLFLTYAGAPFLLVNDNDVPEIPFQYHHRLVDYAIYRCRQVEGLKEFEKSLGYFESFLNGAEDYASYIRDERNVGDKNDKGPFELEAYRLVEVAK